MAVGFDVIQPGKYADLQVAGCLLQTFTFVSLHVYSIVFI